MNEPTIGRNPPARPLVARPAWAVLALAAWATSIVVVIVSLVRAPVLSLIALLLFTVTVGAGWAALVRRSALRIVWIVVAAAAFAGIVALPDPWTFVLPAVVIGLMLLAAITTRAALEHDPAPAVATTVWSPAGPSLADNHPEGSTRSHPALARTNLSGGAE